jgi:carbon monoxide dehydrogenase subunit G
MLFTCRPVGLDFLAHAPWRFENVVELGAPPDRVFALFEDGESWPRWFPGIQRVEWTSPDPKGVGTTRTVTLGMATAHEHFLAWEPGRRFAFRFSGANRPLFRAGVEDYVLEPSAAGTRFTYVVAVEPTWPVRMLAPVTRRVFAKMFRDGAAGLQAYVAR